MTDIRQQVLSFAKNSVGKRIWAQIHSSTIEEKNGILIRHFKPLEESYSYKRTKYSCSDAVTSWESITDNTIFTKNRRNDDFTKKNIVAKQTCKIGNGECWDLAYTALQKNNGLNISIIDEKTRRKWSNQLVNDLNFIKGGEIIEVKNYYYIEFTKAGDSLSWNFGSINSEHTAIIGSSVTKGKVTVYHQNFKGNRTVHTYLFPLKSLILNEGNKQVYLACGGAPVNTFITSATNAGKNIQKLNEVRDKIAIYIKEQKNIIPSQVTIYIPHSNP
jgi:hypothetical protein